MSEQVRNEDHPNEEIDLLDYLNVVVKRRKMIFRNAFWAAVLMAMVSLFLPKTYTATTTLLPPDEDDGSGLKSLLANSPGALLNLAGSLSSTSDIFVEILKSRSVGEIVLKREYAYKGGKHTLTDILDEVSTQDALRKLRKKSTISANEQGIIQVSIELDEPGLSAAVANTFVSALDSVNQQKSFSKASNSRRYIEEQLRLTEASLRTASEALAEFQQQFKAVNLEEQTKVAIEKAGEIKGTIMAKEVQLQVALQRLKKDNPAVLQLQQEVDELKKQFEHLQFGNSVPFQEQKDYFIPFSNVPEVGLKLAKLIREVKVQETVWQLLNQQYYSAKIQEARDTPTVQILDHAVPPERRTKPKRLLLVFVASTLTFLLSVFWAFALEYGERIKEDQNEYHKVRLIVHEVSGDYQRLKKTIVDNLMRLKK